MNFFYDLPVYRLAEEKYYRGREKYVEEALFPEGLPFRDALISRDKADPDINLHRRDDLERSYGGVWLYNEIIGYVKHRHAAPGRLCSAVSTDNPSVTPSVSANRRPGRSL